MPRWLKSNVGGGDADTESRVRIEAESREIRPQVSIRKKMPSAGSTLPGSQVSGLQSCETVNPKLYTLLHIASRVVPQGRAYCSAETL